MGGMGMARSAWLLGLLITVGPALAAPVAAQAGVAPEAASGVWGAERRTVTLANGLRMGYVELGDPGKPAFVFLHGFTNSSLGYLPLGRLLAQRYHVFLLDQRGHGASDKPQCCYSRLDMAYDVKLFLDLKGIRRAHVAGHSMGGMVAPTFAAFWPERIDHLVIIASGLGRRSLPTPDSPRPPPILKGWDAEIRKLQDPIDPDSAFMKDWWDVPGVDERTQSLMRRESARIPADIWRAILDQGESTGDLRLTAHRVKAPTLLLFGGKDVLFGAEDNREQAAWLPHAKTVTLAELGHSAPEQDPPAVAAAIFDFLK
ncbi:MAG: alpha/beta hydrolase [Gammaproteobacteria bacterium]|nr:alpha/beta hydrolase [Gammaproteobacteria bacterium]